MPQIINAATQSIGKKLKQQQSLKQTRTTNINNQPEKQPEQQRTHIEAEKEPSAASKTTTNRAAIASANTIGRSSGNSGTGSSSKTVFAVDAESKYDSSDSLVYLIDPNGVLEFNPQIHVLDNTSTGVSSRKILELLGMKGETSIIPQATHQITTLLDNILQQCRNISRSLDRQLDR